MCTVTIVPIPAGPSFCVMMNRDEQRTRSPAQPPRIVRCGDRRAVMPIDTDSGGTWIAANDQRLAAMLLNVNDERHEGTKAQRHEVKLDSNSSPVSLRPFVPSSLPLLSRGLIIPALMQHANFDDAMQFAASLEGQHYAPFRLLITDGSTVCEIRSNGRVIESCDEAPLSSPMMFTSSGLGDLLVQRPRAQLFEKSFAVPSAQWPDAQRQFHLHHWPDNPPLSVLMTRPDAATVSITTINLAPDAITMRYAAVNDQSVDPHPHVLVLQGAS